MKEPELLEERDIEAPVNNKKLKVKTPKKNKKEKTTKKQVEEVVEHVASNEPDLDLTKMFPNEIITHILSFLAYKDVLRTFYDKRWAALGNSREVWGTFCRKMRWTLPVNNRKMTFKDLFMRRITSKSFCSSCGCKTTAKFPLLQITLCSNCRNKEPEFATLNKTQSKALYFLDDIDLSRVKFVVTNVGWGRKKYVYLKSDIEAAAFEKFGGEEGFEKERTKRLQIKQNKFTLLTQKKERRAQDLEEHLAGIGWHKTFALGPRNFPVLLPTELLNDDYDRYLRAPAKGDPTTSFANVFMLNCHRYLNTGFGAMFTENMSLVNDIEAYLLRERERNGDTTVASPPAPPTTNTITTTSTTSTSSSSSTTSTTSSSPTTSTSTTTTTTSSDPTTSSTNNNNNNDENNNNYKDNKHNKDKDSDNDTKGDKDNKGNKDKKGDKDKKDKDNKDDKDDDNDNKRKTSVNGGPLTTYGGATFDAELRKFYLNIIYARIEQIWQHPGQLNIEPEETSEDDHMGVLFDKHSHFCKRLRTPNHILEQIYDDAMAVVCGQIFGDNELFLDSDSDDDDDMFMHPFGCACHSHAMDVDDDSDDDDGFRIL